MEAGDEVLAVEFMRDGKEFAGEADGEVFFGVGFLFLGEDHFQAGENEERAERDEQPVEALDERHAEPDHRAAHEERAEDAPEQHAVLVAVGDMEVREDEGDDEDVVHRE